MLTDFLFEVVIQTVLVTFFVLLMITVLEYVNVFSQGVVNGFMRKNPSWQIFISAFFGLLPGCLGSYAAVTMYTHEIISFGALLGNLIATTGDEAFFMFSLMPQKAVLIFLILFILSIAAGYTSYVFYDKKRIRLGNLSHFQIHKTLDTNRTHVRGSITENLKNLSAKRLTLIILLLIFSVLIMTGFLSENHEGENGIETQAIKITFTVLSFASLFVVLTCTEHFLDEHIWHHVIGKHFKKVLIWTFAALAVIFFATNIFNIKETVEAFDAKKVEFVMLLIAIAVGLIPESGPHIVFISLYCSGAVPFSVLLANCIVQDGHGAIPLFAENKKDFFIIKGIKAAMALATGAAAMII